MQITNQDTLAVPTNDSLAMSALAGELSMVGQQDLAFMLLANDLLSKALEMRCSDFQIEPDGDQVFLRYLVDGEMVKELQLPMRVHRELAFCYKALAGLNIQESKRPQDKRATISICGADVTIRVTSIPGEHGETIAVSFKFAD